MGQVCPPTLLFSRTWVVEESRHGKLPRQCHLDFRNHSQHAHLLGRHLVQHTSEAQRAPRHWLDKSGYCHIRRLRADLSHCIQRTIGRRGGERGRPSRRSLCTSSGGKGRHRRGRRSTPAQRPRPLPPSHVSAREESQRNRHRPRPHITPSGAAIAGGYRARRPSRRRARLA
jgi:hypothetical protein